MLNVGDGEGKRDVDEVESTVVFLTIDRGGLVPDTRMKVDEEEEKGDEEEED